MRRWIKGLIGLAMLACLLAPTTVADAQEAPKPAEPIPADEKKTEAEEDGRIAVDFSFESLIFIDAKVNGKGPYKFLFDSGATQSVVNERLANELDLEQHDMPGGVQGVGEVEASLVVLDDVTIGNYSRGKCVAASMNLDHISGALGYHMMGIVGQNIIKMIKEIEINFVESKLYFEEYGEEEMPTDQDKMLINMLEGGGLGDALPGLPEIPGIPGGPDEDDPNEDGDGEDEFSINPLPAQQWLLQEGETTTESTEPKVNGNPAEGQTLTYTTVSLPLIGELVPYWYLDCEINGETKTFMFDTGASTLLALGKDLGNDLNLTTSFGYPVKGIGKSEAHASMVDTFTVGNLSVEETPGMIIKLPKISDQLPEMVKQMLPMVAPDLKLDFDGIVGISLATRYRSMTVNTQDKTIEFVAYAEGETNKFAPYPGERFVKKGVIRTWHGNAGKFGLTGDAVEFEEWNNYGLDNGGLMVEEVEEGGAAAKAGIKPGDIITHLVGVADELEADELEDAGVEGEDAIVRDMPALIMIACNEDPGSVMTVRVKRGEERLELEVTLSKYGWEGTIPELYKRK